MISVKLSGFRKTILTGLAALVTALPISAKAYSPGTMEKKSTHPLLAEKSIALYEEVSGRALTSAQREAVVRGTIQEDSPQASSIRSYNHFTTWDSFDGLWGFLSSKQWSTDVTAQTGLVPLDNLINAGAVRGRVLKLFYADALKPFDGNYPEGDRTWQMALSGDMQSVGHVMHLLQDATVPAHVRNDPHGGLAAAISSFVGANFSDAWKRYVDTTDFHDDGYETWARNNPRILEQIRPTEYQTVNQLEAIFDQVVGFTGSNFFSDNSFPGMQHGYGSPALQNRRDFYYYATIEGEEIPLARESFLSNPVFVLANPKPAYFLDAKVLEAQGRILLTKAVEAGAALLDLYFRNATEEPGCVPHTRTYCDRGDLYFEDGCGARELVEQCTSYQECENAACVDQTTCSNRCSYEGEAECIDSDSWRECGYFESSCLSWSESYQCGADEACSSGECVEGPSCDSHASKICGEGENVYWRDSCGNLEEIAERCSSSQSCENARCVEDVVGCQNECSPSGAKVCAGANTWKECGDYDADSCTEWGSTYSCTGQEMCEDGSCISPPRFVDGGDGTVLDNETALRWQKTSSSTRYNWFDAISYCYGLSLRGSNQWDLPTSGQLRSINRLYQENVECGLYAEFEGPCSTYWTSSTWPENCNTINEAVFGLFASGSAYLCDMKDTEKNVRCVLQE